MPEAKPAKKKRKRRLDKELLAQLQKLKANILLLESEAAMNRASARRQVSAIARDLVPVAAGLARKGRPRLLAVLSKILGDQSMITSLDVNAHKPRRR